MYAKSLALASAVALAASVVAAQPEHPRIYFPREIKREYHNSTITSKVSSSTPHVTTTTTTTSSSSTRRDLLSDLISEILGSDSPQKSSTTEKPPVPTVAVDSTPTPGGSSGSGLPKETVLPTSKINESKTSSSARARPSTEPGIVIGPTGIVSSTSEPKTTVEPSKKTTVDSPKVTSVDASASNSTVPETNPPTPATAKDPIPTGEPPKQTSVDPAVTNNTTPETKPTTPITVDKPTKTGEPATKSTTVDTLVGNNTVSDTTPTTTSGGILDPIGTLLSSLLPGSSSASTSASTKTNSPEQTGTSISSTSTSSPEQPIPQNSTTQAAPTTEPSTGLLPSLTSLLPLPGSTTTTSGSGSLPNATSTEVPVTATSSSSGSIITNSPTATTTDVPIGNSTSTSSGTVSSAPTSAPTATDVPITNGTISEPPTGTATSVPTTPISVPNDNSTVIVGPTTTSNIDTVVPTTKSDFTSTVAPSTTTGVEVTSIRPTATLPNTDNWLPTTVIIEPTTFSFSSPTSNPTETSLQALPSTVPRVIRPDTDGDKKPPVLEGAVPIHIAFNYTLHYLFLANDTMAASQIFKYLPDVLSSACGLPADQLPVTELAPYNTLATRGFVTTLARMNYTKALLPALAANLKTPSSAIYQNRDPVLHQFASYIDSTISPTGELNDGSSTDNGGPGSGNDGNSNNSNGNGNDAFGSGNQGDQTPKQKATTAGIAVAAVGFCALYGAAMFIVARRYKRKRQGHRRASSIVSGQGSPEMRYNDNASPALMGGALLSRDGSTYGGTGGRDSHASGGHSGRTANISAPVATENSLGWN
ncbi:uncharacterized protein G6M90_00g085480 [Metarhizium brunneum]|uniref:Signaling mucin MSB2 n=1 Tax=Metarhizium brunneum TaxID=500148 RepID=A0A7D5V3W0_9HYPO